MTCCYISLLNKKNVLGIMRDIDIIKSNCLEIEQLL